MKKFLRSVYKAVPFKKQLFSTLKLFWSPSERIYRHLSFKAILNVKVDQDHQFKVHHYGYQIENEIFWAGLQNAWEKESFKWWIELSKRSEVVIDIGANTGIYSLISKCMNPSAKVYAFEPVKRVHEKLVANSMLNNFGIISIDKAISSYDGEAVFYDSKAEHIYSVTINLGFRENDPRTERVTTTVMKLDTFIENEKLTKIDLIKIDVEMHEAEVMDGFRNYIGKFKPAILIEIQMEEAADRINEMMKDLGYLYFNIHEVNGIRRTDTITRSDHFNFLLCTEETAREIGLM